MASYLRPRRGKKATATSQLTASAPLKRGEVFFEVPDTGVGTGTGKIKMGDGTTAYASLPYFLEQPTVDYTNAVVAWTNTTAADSDPYSTNATYAANIIPSASLKTIFTNLKKLLLNYNSQLTTLNNDLANKQPKGSYASSNHNHNGVYQPAGSYADASHSHTFASLTSKPTTLSGYGITDVDVRQLTDDIHGYIKIKGYAIIYGSFPMEGMDRDESIGGYSKSISLSSDVVTTGKSPFCLAAARYPAGFPKVAIKALTTTTITISCDVNVDTGWVQWMYINKI